MAKRKSRKPKLAAVAAASPPASFHNPASLQERNPLIGLDPEDTMSACAEVLAFVADFHLRESANEVEQEVESGEYHVLWFVKDALEKQAKAMEEAKFAEAANG